MQHLESIRPGTFLIFQSKTAERQQTVAPQTETAVQTLDVILQHFLGFFHLSDLVGLFCGVQNLARIPILCRCGEAIQNG